MKKIKILLILSLFISCTYLMSCSEEPLDYVKIGMSYDKVCYYLGEPDDEELMGVKDGIYLKLCYWFEGASSIDEANAKYQDEKNPVVYTYVVFSSKDQEKWKIRKIDLGEESKYDKNDRENVIGQGLWGVS